MPATPEPPALRRHIFLADDTSVCGLESNTGQIERAGQAAEEVPACGPCLLAVSVLSAMSSTLLTDQPLPEQDVAAAVEELLSGPFSKMYAGDVMRDYLASVEERSFADWFTVVLTRNAGAPNPSGPTPSEPAGSGTVATGPQMQHVNETGPKFGAGRSIVA